MKKQELLDLLADHAQALNDEGAERLDTATWLVDDGPAARGSSVVALLQLAQAVKRVLVPVEPSALFQSELRAKLERGESEAAGKRPFSREVWLGAAAAGAVGLLFLIVRLLSNRSRPAATAV